MIFEVYFFRGEKDAWARHRETKVEVHDKRFALFILTFIAK